MHVQWTFGTRGLTYASGEIYRFSVVDIRNLFNIITYIILFIMYIYGLYRHYAWSVCLNRAIL